MEGNNVPRWQRGTRIAGYWVGSLPQQRTAGDARNMPHARGVSGFGVCLRDFSARIDRAYRPIIENKSAEAGSPCVCSEEIWRRDEA